MRVTRRKLAELAGVMVGVAATAQAQTPPPPADLDQAAREGNRRSSDVLAKYEIPLGTEPAFQFKA